MIYKHTKNGRLYRRIKLFKTGIASCNMLDPATMKPIKYTALDAPDPKFIDKIRLYLVLNANLELLKE